MKKLVIILFSIFLMICCASCLTACGGGGDDTDDNNNPTFPKEELTSSEIYKKVNPSVVFILINNLQGYASGTGFFIDDDGTIVTNYHVIEDGIAGVIQLSDGTQATIGNVLGYDENLDIAVLETTATNTTPVEIGDSSLVEVGDTVYAIGYPEASSIGFSSSTFTTGMVSMHRSIDGYTYIQSTVDITHGNSGGTLINAYGEVVGITTAGLNVGDVDYMNLSIPIQRVDTVALDDNESLLVVTKRHYPVYAKFYNGSSLFTTQTLKYEQTATKPSSSPSKTGYTFAGWYADSGLTKPFDFSTKILEDTKIYAKFDINTYKVTYNLNSGNWSGTTPDSTWTINSCGIALPVPVRSGYLFEGWTDSNGYFVDSLPNSSNLGNVTYNARWIEGAEHLVINNGVVSDYTGNSKKVVIPDSYRGVLVTKINSSVFSGCIQLETIILSNNIITIGSSAFYNCSKLSEITIPDSVTSIGSSAFEGCNKLSKISAPAAVAGKIAKQTSVTEVIITSGSSIPQSAFRDCTGLTSITIPDSVTSIGSYAFSGCSKLSKISAPAAVAGKIAKQTSVTEVIITSGSSIPQFAFGGCTGLTSIIIPDSVTSISYYAFEGCTGLTSITIPNSVYSIDSSVFEGCTGLTSIIIPDSVTSIGSYAFEGCTGLTSITIPDSVTSIGNMAFANTKFFNTDSNWKNNILYIGKHLIKARDSIEGSHVIEDGTLTIASSAFEGCTGLTSITIPDSVTSIGFWAFRDCTGLTSITIPDSVTSIGSSAFEGCTGLTSITIPNGVYSIGSSAFSGCSKLSKISAPAAIAGTIAKQTSATEVIITSGNSIPNSAFNGCTGLTSITIPDSVASIGSSAFDGCTGLTSITIPDSVYSIGSFAFYNCTGLTSITIPNGVTSIGDYAFEGCSKLSKISAPAAIAGTIAKQTSATVVIITSGNFIPNSAFSYCTGLTSITIPDSVTYIGDYAFEGCTGLTSITIPDSVTSIPGTIFYGCNKLSKISAPAAIAGTIARQTSTVTEVIITSGSSIPQSAFIGCTELTSITIPDSVTSIGDYAFEGCTGLTSIIIPDSVTSIGYSAFEGCTGLTSITIPDSVTSIGYSAFEGCTGLTSITIPDSVTSIGYSAFEGCTGLTSITIPDSVTSIGDMAFANTKFYNTDSNWKNNILYIGKHLIKARDSIEGSHVIEDGTLTIASSAFEGCTGLTSITIPDSVTSIGSWAFRDCTGLTSIIFENTNDWKAGEVSISKNSLSNPSTAATYLTITYRYYSWRRG